MNNNNIKQQVIRHLAEQGVPENYNPWEAVHKRLEQNPTQRVMGERANRTVPVFSKQNLRYAGLAALVIALLAGSIFFMTPSGRVTAQNLFSFFFKADSDQQALPEGGQVEMTVSTSTPVPTSMVELQPIDPGKSFQTATQVTKTIHSQSISGLTIQEAEELAQFPIVTPESLPAGYSLGNVEYIPAMKMVIQTYKFAPYQAGEMFFISQQLELPVDEVGESAVVGQFTIGDTSIENVNGSWFKKANSPDSEEWISDDPIHTFHWQKDGFYFTAIFFIGDDFSPAYLNGDDMRAMLEVILGVRQAFPDKVNLNNLRSIDEVRQVAGFPILSPTLLLEGYIFSYGVFEPDPQRVVLHYAPEAGTRQSSNAPLIIMEVPISPSDEPRSYESFPDGAVETIAIGDYEASLTQGEILDGIYDPDVGSSITWETDALYISIRMYYSSSYEARLEKEDMIELAESMQE